MNPKIQKLTEEIDKITHRIKSLEARLIELEAQKDELEKTRTAYLAAIARLEAEAVTARSELPANVRRKVGDSLAAVDSAIAECEQALAENRADPESQKMLVALYEEKIRVLDATIATRHGGKK